MILLSHVKGGINMAIKTLTNNEKATDNLGSYLSASCLPKRRYILGLDA